MEQYQVQTTKPFYSTNDIVEATHLSRSLIQRLIARGDLPSVLLGDRRLITANVYRRFLENGTKGLKEEVK